MQLRFRTLTILSAIIILASCSKKNEQGKLIPKDAAFVLHIDGASMNAKLPWEEVKQNALFQKMYADSTLPAVIKAALDNPDNSGIDIKNDLVVYMIKDSTGGYVGFSGTVKDAEKFKTFNTEAVKGKGNGTTTPAVSSEADGITYLNRAPVTVGWNKSRFIYVMDAPQLNMLNDVSLAMRDSNMVMPDPIKRDLNLTAKNLFNLKGANSLGEDEKFTDLVKTKGDAHLWFNAESFNKGMMEMAAMSMMNLDKLYKGNIMTATASFENGKILVEAKSYASKEFTSLMKKYSGDSFNQDMVKRIPSKDVAAVFALNFKPEGIKELVKLMGMEGLANIGLAFMGFTLDDFVKANKGDILIAITNLRTKMDSSGNHAVGSKSDMDFLFSASVGDKESFNKLMTAGERLGREKGSDSMPIPISIKNDGKYFAIGNTKDNVDRYMAGGNNSFDFLDKISGEPFGGYINLQYILKAMGSAVSGDSTSKAIYNTTLTMWDNVYIKGGGYKGDAMRQTIEINMLDKNTNSLKQLNVYLGKVAELMDLKKKNDQIIITGDTAVVVRAVPAY